MGKEQKSQIELETDAKIAIWRSLRNYQSAQSLAEANDEDPSIQEFYQNFAQYYLENAKSIMEAIFPGKIIWEVFSKPNKPT